MLDRKFRMHAFLSLAAFLSSASLADTITNDGTLTDPVTNTGSNAFLNNGTILAPVLNQDEATFENRVTGVVGYVENTSAAYFNNQGLVNSVFVNRDFATLFNTGTINQLENYSLGFVNSQRQITRSVFNYGLGSLGIGSFATVGEHVFNYSFGSVKNTGRIYGHAFNDGLGRFHNAGIVMQNAYNGGQGTFENAATISGNTYNSGGGFFRNDSVIHGSVYNYNSSAFDNSNSVSAINGDVHNYDQATFRHATKIKGSVYNDASFAVVQPTPSQPALINGNFFQSSSGNLVLSINSQNASSTKLAIAGTANFAGTLTVTHGDLDPAIGSRYPLLSYKAIRGHFDTLNGSIIDESKFFGLDYQDAKLDLITLATPKRLNRDGTFGHLTDSTNLGSGLILITHGRGSNVDVWATGMATAIQQQISSPDNWETATFDWRDLAAPLDAPEVARRANQIGDSLANWMREEGLHFSNIHGLAHSAGVWLINRFGEEAPQAVGATFVHDTFFDAFVPSDGVSDSGREISNLGQFASIAEQFVDHRKSLAYDTNATLEYASNIDVTGADPDFIHVLHRTAMVHGWPYRWYQESVLNPSNPKYEGVGFFRSAEFLGYNPSIDKADIGQRKYLPSSVFIRSDSTTPVSLDLIHIIVSDPNKVNVTSGVLELKATSNAPNTLPQFGEPPADDDVPTGDPTLATLIATLDQPVNSLVCDFSFSGAGGGLYSIYFNGHFVAQYDQRYIGNDVASTGLLFLGQEYEPGTYTILFRLDPYDGLDSSVSISNLRLAGPIPEPQTFLFLALPMMIRIRLRRPPCA